MSSISAGTSAGTALVSTGDTTGALVFKTGASATTAMTIGADQSVTFVGAVSGTPGSGGTTASGSVVLTSASAGAQSITTTAYGQSVTLPSATTLSKGACLYTINNLGHYPLKIVDATGTTKGFIGPLATTTVGLADNTTSAGTWVFSNVQLVGVGASTQFTASSSGSSTSVTNITIDSTRDLNLIASNSNTYGVIYNKSTNTWGSATLIRTGATSFYAIKSATDQALIVSFNATTGMEAVVLTLSGTTITVGIAATATLAGNFNLANKLINTLIAVGTSWVVSYVRDGLAICALRALTISGTTVTIGAEVNPSGNTNPARLYAVSSSVVLALSGTTTALYATPYTVSGSTLSVGTAATVTTTNAFFCSYAMTSRWAVVYQNTTVFGGIINVTGTTATISSTSIISAGNASTGAFYPTATKIVYATTSSSTAYVNTFTDSAGTISAGTQTTLPFTGTLTDPLIYPENSNSVILYTTSGTTFYTVANIDVSSANPVVTPKFYGQIAATSSILMTCGTAFNTVGNCNTIKFKNGVTNASMGGLATNVSFVYSGYIGIFSGQLIILPPISVYPTNSQVINSGATIFCAQSNLGYTSFPINYIEAAQ
jgi:hypothetical protein